MGGAVVVSTTLSLDGFMAGPNHEMDWIFDGGFLADEPSAPMEELIAATGAILAGRGSYDVGEASRRDETSAAFGGRWSGPEFVLTHRPPPDDTRVTFLSGDVRAAVATARDAAGGKSVLVLGGDIARQCLEADLVDELVLVVLPVLLGDGISLFGSGGGAQLRFETVDVTPWGQAAVLRYRRAR